MDGVAEMRICYRSRMALAVSGATAVIGVTALDKVIVLILDGGEGHLTFII